VQPLLEPKQEEGTSKDANFGLENDLRNRVVKVEKMLQNQLVISPPKPINQRRPYQNPKVVPKAQDQGGIYQRNSQADRSQHCG
jgi:hypothetical protein